MVNLYIFNESNRAAVYGIGTYIKELTAALKESSVHISIVHLYSEKTDGELPESDNVPHIHIPSPVIRNSSLDRQKQNELYYRNIVYLLRLQIKDTENLVFHLNCNQYGKLAEELKKSFDCCIITTIHYLDWCFSLFGNVTRFKKILSIHETDRREDLKEMINESYRKEKYLFKTVDHIICLSENMRQILQDAYQIKPDKMSVIYNGLTDSMCISDNQQVLRQKYHIPDIPVIIFAGRLDEIKGLIYVLQAFKIVLNTHPHCHFFIVGNGTFDIFMKECENIWMHVTWTGLVDKEKLYDLYSIADIGILPSFHEQCSYVAIEMMMHGLPIIGSTTTGLKDMIVDGETGLHIHVIEHDASVEIDVSLLAKKMLYLLQQPEERQRMGANARRRYETVYSAAMFRKNMLNFYHSLFKQTYP